MKKLLFVAMLLVSNAVCGQDIEGDWIMEHGYAGTDGVDRVTINGVTWATRNIGIPGNFVHKPEDYGALYESDTAQEACPSGWRLPTKQEFEKLVVSGYRWYKLNNVEGALFGSYDGQGEPAFLFLPYGGAGGPDGWGHDHRDDGVYWSDTADPKNAEDVYYLNVYKTGLGIYSIVGVVRHSVRCVLGK